MSFIERITNEFSFYKQEELYFKRIAIRSNYVYSAAISRIIKDIENDWNNLEIDWFINYCLINNNLDLVATLGDYDIIISYEQLQYILNTYPDFDLLLASIIRKNNITIKEIVFQILNNDNLIEDGVTNYNYEFLDPLSNKSKEVNILLENNNLINISNILQNIKKNNIIFNGEDK